MFVSSEKRKRKVTVSPKNEKLRSLESFPVTRRERDTEEGVSEDESMDWVP